LPWLRQVWRTAIPPHHYGTTVLTVVCWLSQVQVCFTSVCGQVQPLDVALSNSVRHKSCNDSSARLVIRHSRKAANKRSQRSSQVLSGEHSAHVCTRLSSSEEGRIPEAGVGEMRDTLACSALSSCKAPGVWHQGHALHDLLLWSARTASGRQSNDQSPRSEAALHD
jgi:hypothetical protein